MIKNEYKIKDNYVIIYLKKQNGEMHETYIDLDDFERVLKYKYKWGIHWNYGTKSYYSKTTQYLGEDKNGKFQYRTLPLHRFILNEPDGIVDHINHNTLDNRKFNLRVVESKNNTKNRKGRNSNNTSGYRNVSFDKRANKWMVQMQINGKNTRLGNFDDVDKAGEFAKEMREKYYKEYSGKN